MTIEHSSLFIDGRWLPPTSSRRFTALNAATGEVLGSAPEAMPADVDRAVAAARRALTGSAWSELTRADRAALLRRFADELERRACALTRTVSSQNGMPIRLSEAFEGAFAIGLVRYYADLIATTPATDIRASQGGIATEVTAGPIGVVAAIVPWNYPVVLALSKIAPALAAGCTVVVKPSPSTVLDSYLMAEAAVAAGFPAGVLNWVPANRQVGAYLVAHPGVDKVAFTGSTEAGRAVAAACAPLLRPVTLELGGKSAAIILDDADLDVLMPDLEFITLMNNGQTCVACSRILAPRHRYDEVVDALVARLATMKIGDPLDPGTEIGPLATAEHRERVRWYIEKGRSEGRLVLGGGRPAGFDRGWFIEPTVFADVDNSAVIAQEEIFGPVLAVIGFDDDADAIRLANDSAYGLGGVVFSGDHVRAQTVAARVRTGTIGINGYPVSIGSPFGGVRDSGYGREFGPEALTGYQSLKSVYIGA
ncbi:aldehyde dehydrogenase [Nocardia sp. IFM 10818]